MYNLRGETLLSERVLGVEERIEQFIAEHDAPGISFEFWVFAGHGERTRIRQKHARKRKAFDVEIHSAFKPLITELYAQRDYYQDLPPTKITIECPTHPATPERRFELEAYPAARLVEELWPGTEFALTSKPTATETPVYTIVFEFQTGEQRVDVVAPNKLVTTKTGREAFTPCGWFRITGEAGEVREGPFQTPYEDLYEQAMNFVEWHFKLKTAPYFETLKVFITHNGEEIRLPVAHERIDTAEALHEELYFSLLEHFAHVADLPTGSRQLTPGQILPVVVNSAKGKGINSVIISANAPMKEWEVGEEALTSETLRAMTTGPRPADVAATMRAFPGTQYTAETVQGRTAHGVWHEGTLPAVVINAGQHANETSGIVGALRAMHELSTVGGANVGVVALENPDGYILQRYLRSSHREHMHHAARYSALGNDVSFHTEEQPYESQVRRDITKDSGANLIVNLHGYPAHEWIRPLTGYLPHGFEWWAMPQGFILMARYQPGFAQTAEELLRGVAQDVQAAVPGLVAYNQAMLDSYELHAGKLLFPLEGVIPIALSEAREPGPSIEIITEYPDETVHGRDFFLAHETQFASAVSAAKRWWKQ